MLLAPARVWGQPGDAPRFTDVSEAAGVVVAHAAVVDVMRMGVGTGAAWLDYDADGDLDLYVTQGEGPNALFRNGGDGTFTEVAGALGAADADHAGAGVAVADYDNDGWPDLYLANSDADVLLKNDGGTGFVDVTAVAGFPLDERARGTSAAWGDYDGDGFLDLYVTNHMDLRGLSFDSQDRLYHNDGDGTFTDVSVMLDAEAISGYGFIGGWTDYDNDGDVDLLLVNDCPFGEEGRYQPTRLFRNDGGTDPLAWVFTEVSETAGVDHCRHGMGFAAGDYDRNGWIDYFYTNIGKRTTLLTNDRGTFADRAEAAGVFVGFDPSDPGAPFQGTFSWGATFFDYDRDGWLDLYVAAGALPLGAGTQNPQPNALFHNTGDGTFTDVSAESSIALPDPSRTSIVGDYDGDGDLDLFVVNVGEEGRLFRNERDDDRHYLIVDLEGTASNRDGIGARVTVTTPDGAVQHVETRSGSSLGGTDAPAAFFGLDDQTTAASLRIRWPSGTVQTLTEVAADQRLKVVEPETPTAAETELLPAATGLTALYPNPSRDGARITYRLAAASDVTLCLYDLLGRIVRRLEEGYRPQGLHRIVWDGTDERGRRAAPGVYVVRLTAGGTTWSRPLLRVP